MRSLSHVRRHHPPTTLLPAPALDKNQSPKVCATFRGETTYTPPPPSPHDFGQTAFFRERVYILEPLQQEFHTPPPLSCAPTPRRVFSGVGGGGGTIWPRSDAIFVSPKASRKSQTSFLFLGSGAVKGFLLKVFLRGALGTPLCSRTRWLIEEYVSETREGPEIPASLCLSTSFHTSTLKTRQETRNPRERRKQQLSRNAKGISQRKPESLIPSRALSSSCSCSKEPPKEGSCAARAATPESLIMKKVKLQLLQGASHTEGSWAAKAGGCTCANECPVITLVFYLSFCPLAVEIVATKTCLQIQGCALSKIVCCQPTVSLKFGF